MFLWCPFSTLKLVIGFPLNALFSGGLKIFYWSILVPSLQVQEQSGSSSSDFAATSRRMIIYTGNPMDTPSSIRHRFDIEIPGRKSVDISSIMKGESTWKEWHRFDADNWTSIQLSKSMKYRWVFQVFFRCHFDVESTYLLN